MNLFDLQATLSLNTQEFDQGISDSANKASTFGDVLKGSLAANAISAGFSAVVNGAKTAVSALADMGKQAVDSYKNYEQLAGGIQKLFGKESAGTVAQFAQEAYLTSGKSINEYYNSVSQITASLKRSVGGDMDEVARVADIAMRAISDNVNTFGSDAESVENAIMGLSRNNYQMLDNLRLGYAGTAQGMLELINDSGVLGEKLTSTSELATVGFDKMILAIQKVQEQQGIRPLLQQRCSLPFVDAPNLSGTTCLGHIPTYVFF